MDGEALSALLDGDCSAPELDRILTRLQADPALRDQLSRLCLARELRAGAWVRPDPGFADRVMAALPPQPEASATVAPPEATPAIAA